MPERFKVCKSDETNNYKYGPPSSENVAEKLLSDSHNVSLRSHNMTGL